MLSGMEYVSGTTVRFLLSFTDSPLRSRLSSSLVRALKGAFRLFAPPFSHKQKTSQARPPIHKCLDGGSHRFPEIFRVQRRAATSVNSRHCPETFAVRVRMLREGEAGRGGLGRGGGEGGRVARSERRQSRGLSNH